jgi:hypothetical protein
VRSERLKEIGKRSEKEARREKAMVEKEGMR